MTQICYTCKWKCTLTAVFHPTCGKMALPDEQSPAVAVLLLLLAVCAVDPLGLEIRNLFRCVSRVDSTLDPLALEVC